MAFQQDEGGFQKKMYQGDWKCGKCGTAIKELPFEPDANRIDQIKCRDCYRQGRSFRKGNY
ncbi:MAG: hypothetical protein HY435_00050 [Candidatus Liptonbacteria bacterium]|nr:hypothetical protein [Candidatus Liptonbacteria bacterium]